MDSLWLFFNEKEREGENIFEINIIPVHDVAA